MEMSMAASVPPITAKAANRAGALGAAPALHRLAPSPPAAATSTGRLPSRLTNRPATGLATMAPTAMPTKVSPSAASDNPRSDWRSGRRARKLGPPSPLATNATATAPARGAGTRLFNDRQRAHRERPHPADRRRHREEAERSVPDAVEAGQVLDDGDAGGQQRAVDRSLAGAGAVDVHSV